MKVLLGLLAVLATAAVAATAAPQANAATSYPVSETFSVFGYDVNIAGTATLVSVQVSGNSITATGTFVGTGTVSDPVTGTTLLQFPISATLSATVSNLLAACDSGTLSFDIVATLTLTQPFPASYTFGPTTVTITAGTNHTLHNLICQIEGLIDNGSSLNSVVDKLNVVLKKA
jgi:hypothetical protein